MTPSKTSPGSVTGGVVTSRADQDQSGDDRQQIEGGAGRLSGFLALITGLRGGSLTARLIFLVVVFLAVPLVLYRLLEAADDDKRALLLKEVHERGRLVQEILRPYFEAEGLNALPEISTRLRQLSADDITLRLFFKPAGGTDPKSFFYLASAPSLSAPELAAERAELNAFGVFDTLARSCLEGEALVTRHTLSRASEEVVIAVTPHVTASGCWSLVTAYSTAAYRDSSIGRPYWATPEIRLGAVIYFAMFLVTLTIFWGIWRALRRLTQRSRSIRAHGLEGGSFAEAIELVEFAEVARELDRMVTTLNQSAQTLKAIAEQNAHAFKGPVAVIRQSVEPVRKRAGENDPRLDRAVAMIDASLDKLDDLITYAWRVDETLADLLDPPRDRIDLSALLERVAKDYRMLAEGHRRHMVTSIADNVQVIGGAELIEAIVENLVDNALSFTPPNGNVYLDLVRDKSGIRIVVADEGPGISEDLVTAVFDRYFSRRRDDKGIDGERHLGMGLWIVRRNAEALGGSVEGANRTDGGFRVTVHLPPAPEKA